MKPKNWKKIWFYVIFASSSTMWCWKNEIVKAAHPNKEKKSGEFVSRISFFTDSHLMSESPDNSQVRNEIKKSNDLSIVSEPETIHTESFSIKVPVLIEQQENIRLQPDNQELSVKPVQIAQEQPPQPAEPPNPENVEKNPPPLDSQPTELPKPSPEEIQKKLDPVENGRAKRLETLLQRLEENKKKAEQQSSNTEIVVRVEEVPLETPQPPEQELPSIEKFIIPPRPIGFLFGNVGYFHTSNIFSSGTNAIDDGLIFTGITLAASPFQIGPKTYLNGSIGGGIIMYSDQSEFNYNQLRFNLSIFQQLSSRMYSEIGWNNQQLFYAKDSDRFNFASGDKFLDENSFRLSIGRRDPIAPKLNLDSFYELRLSITDPPEKRNRIMNYAWLSLNYNLQDSLRVGIDYQFNLSNFLERSREDQYHRLSANLRYGISDLSSINLQSGFTLGGSTDSNIDFDGWFFSVNYNLDLGRF